MSGIGSIRKLAGSKYLSLYELDAIARDGSHFPYYMASRTGNTQELKATTGSIRADGVAVYAVYQGEYLVMLRQYRYPVGGYVYEFPAGLVEPGEDVTQAAIRELYEETGLTLTPVHTARPYYTTVGMTDEACATVFGTCQGTPNVSHQEDTEDIQVLLVDRKEAARILKEEQVAIMCAYHLMHFLSDTENPLSFVDKL